MTQVGIEVLKSQLAKYVRLAKDGEKVVVTEDGRPVALLSGIAPARELGQLWNLVSSGAANWKGGKPKGSANPPKIQGKTTAEMIIEDRR